MPTVSSEPAEAQAANPVDLKPEEFLQFLWSGVLRATRRHPLIEIPIAYLDGPPSQSDYEYATAPHILRDVIDIANRQRWAIYFGFGARLVTPTLKTSANPYDCFHVRSREDNVDLRYGPFAWLDLDPPKAIANDDHALRTWREQQIKVLLAHPFPPSVIVCSGRGLYAFWRIALPDGRLPTLRHAIGQSRRFQHEFGGDPKVVRVTGMLRLPGSFNYKNDRARPVEIVHANEKFLVVDDGVLRLAPEKRKKADGPIVSPPSDETSALCSRCRATIASWPPDDGARDAAFRVALAYASHGYEADDVVVRMAAVATDPSRRSTSEPEIRRQVDDVFRRLHSGELRYNRCCTAKPRMVRGWNVVEPFKDRTHSTLEKARADISAKIEALALNKSKGKRSLFVSAPPGLGKTTITRAVFPEVSLGRAARVIYSAPTRELAKDFKRDLKKVAPSAALETGVLLGRHRDDRGFRCTRMDDIERITAQGRSTQTYCRMCPDRHGCEWRANFRQATKKRFVTTSHALLAGQRSWLRDALLFVDEDLLDLIMPVRRVGIRELRKYAAAAINVEPAGRALAGFVQALVDLSILASENIDATHVLAHDKEALECARQMIALQDDPGSTLPWEARGIGEDDAPPSLTNTLMQIAEGFVDNPANFPLRVCGERLEFSLKNQPMLRLIKQGRVIATDATAPLPLVRRLGFEVEEVKLGQPKNLKVIAVVDRLYGSGNLDEVEDLADSLLREDQHAAVVVPKNLALRLKESVPEAEKRIVQYGRMRGSNQLVGMDIRRIVVVRHMANPEGLLFNARRWAVALGDDEPIPPFEFTSGDMPFVGTAWTRSEIKPPHNEILREVYEADRKEVIQAIYRTRPFTNEQPITAFVLDGHPVPGLAYDRVLLDSYDSDIPGSLADAAELIVEQVEAENEAAGSEEFPGELFALELKLRAARDKREESRVEPLKKANESRAAEAKFRTSRNAEALRRYLADHPDAAEAEIRRDLGFTEWGLRKAKKEVNAAAARVSKPVPAETSTVKPSFQPPDDVWVDSVA